MIYFYLSLAALTVIALNGATFAWFINNQDNNALHKIVNLWLKDPIERALLVDQDMDCPGDTSEERVVYRYGGNNGLCECQAKNDDTYNNNGNRVLYSKYGPKQAECGNLYCSFDQTLLRVEDYIPSADVDIFFQKNGNSQKICITRIGGYSFAKKAPLEISCNSDEKYCSWQTENPENFDMDHGYCIPQNKECYKLGFEFGNYDGKKNQQLPLVDFDVSETESSEYNIVDISTIKELDMLKMNDVDYPSVYDSLTEIRPYYFKAINIPRVKVRCRSQLMDTLDLYIGNKGAYDLSLGLLIVSVISGFLCIYFGVCDLFHLSNLKKIPYCEAKRVGPTKKLYENVMMLLKPLSLFTQVILLLVLIKRYLIIFDEMNRMINEQCLDQYVSSAIGFQTQSNVVYCNPTLIYVAIGLSSANFIFDQNVYILIKNIILIILCQKNLSCQKPIQIQQIQIGEDINNNNNNQNNNNDELNNPQDPNNKKLENENKSFIQMKFEADKNKNAQTQLMNERGKFQLTDSQISQYMVSNDQQKLEKLRKKQEKIKLHLEKMKLEEQRILGQQKGMNFGIETPDQNFKILFQNQNYTKPPEAPQPPEESDKQSDSHIKFDF